MGKKTGLYARHVAAGAKLVDFGGWDMPLHYGSQINEHHAVRNEAGVFDVSHMTVVDVSGADSRAWLRYLLANDVDRLQSRGKGLYSCMLNAAGGVVDDLIVYWRGDDRYRMVVNAATRDADLAWMEGSIGESAVKLQERTDLAMLAVQGPRAREIAAALMAGDTGEAAMQLSAFESLESNGTFVARTGYTGEDGWEILLDQSSADRLWDDLLQGGVQPCGLGARDTLRLEAGLNLYGQDMDMNTSPLESNLGWTVAWEPADRDFVGRFALAEKRSAGTGRQLKGLVLDGRGIMRSGQTVRTNGGEGRITSGGFSPTAQCSIAMARLPAGAEGHCEVKIRDKYVTAHIVKMPFVRNGQIKIEQTNQ